LTTTDASSGILLTLDRGIRVLEHIAQSEGRATAKEVSGSLGINPGTTYQLLRTLQTNGYVNRGAGGRYELGMRVGYLVDQYTSRAAPPQALLDILQDLHTATDETVYVSMVSGPDIKIVASLEGTQRLRVGKSNVGYFAHPHARASGKAFLAFCDQDKLETYLPNRKLPARTENTITDWDQLMEDLEAIRLRGVAYERGEFDSEVACMGSVIVDVDGTPVGAYAVSLPAARFLAQKNAMATELLRVGDAASRWLGYKGDYPPRQF
jgi:IclR family acetate operon transcriptional repressor